VLTAAVATRVIYEVPELKRAVVQTVAFSNRGTAAGGGYFTMHGSVVLYVPLPVGSQFQFTSLRWTVYRRESVELYLTNPGCVGVASGYLFDDPANEGPPPVTQIPNKHIEALPAEEPLPWT
jgi:hypothetical protein